MSRRRLLLSGKNSNLILLGKRFAAHERRHERYPVQGQLHGCIIHEDGRTTEVLLSDISKGGLSYFVSMEHRLHKPDDKVVLKIVVGDTDQVVECAFTLRSRRVDERGLYRHGLEVMGDARDQRVLARLEEFVRRPQLSEAA